ncbi:MAG: hypothetical protein AB7G93_00900 [Bdellovibrionales bacterium]
MKYLRAFIRKLAVLMSRSGRQTHEFDHQVYLHERAMAQERENARLQAIYRGMWL